jgi:hypothetical protein
LTVAAPAQDVLTAAHPWVRRLLRLGFVARGVLYSSIGLLTLWNIFRSGEKAHGGVNTTFTSIQALAPGMVMLAGLAAGFAGFAVGMFWTAVFDWNFVGTKPAGLLHRAGCVVIGLVHLSLAASTLLLAAATSRKSTARAAGPSWHSAIRSAAKASSLAASTPSASASSFSSKSGPATWIRCSTSRR